MIEGLAQGSAASLRYGMVGGGQGAFIGDVHRHAIALEGCGVLSAGCFSRSYDNTLATGRPLGIPDSRLYRTFEEMAEAESKRPDRIDFAVIVTPNVAHFAAAKAFLSRGIHVVCDKPFTCELKEAEELGALSERNGLLLCVTYTYTGYPVVKHARELIAKGEIGEVRFVNAEYPQEWLSTPIEKDGQKQAAWRTDPGSHGRVQLRGRHRNAHREPGPLPHRAQDIARLCARLDVFGAGRALDDNASILLEYQGGAKGLYWSSQIAVGYDNALRARVFGTEGSVEWSQENPNYLSVARLGQPVQVISRGRDSLYPARAELFPAPGGTSRGILRGLREPLPELHPGGGHPEGGRGTQKGGPRFPGSRRGYLRGALHRQCVESSKKGAIWVDF